MQLYDYPEYKSQIAHDAFINRIESLNLEELDEDIQKSVLKLLDFIYEWISEHILGMDLKIKDYFESLKPKKFK